MAEKKKTSVILLQPASPAVAELAQQIADKQLAEIVTVESPDEAVQISMQFAPCVLMACLQHNADVPSRVQMMKKLEASVKHSGVKTLMVSKIKNRQVADLMTQKLGVTDFIEEPIPARTMLFKANLLLKAVETFRKIQDAKKAQQEQIVFKKTEQKTPEAAKTFATKQKPALQVAGDTFLFRNSGIKKNGKKVLVELEGPDPETGEWVKHEDKGDAQASWRWVPNEEKEAQEKGQAPQDGWVHSGEKPVFNEKSKKWQMVSEKPELALHKEGKKIAEKIGTDEQGEVTIAEDSPEAEENLKRNLVLASKIKKTKSSAAAPREGKKTAPEEKSGDAKPSPAPAPKPAAAGEAHKTRIGGNAEDKATEAAQKLAGVPEDETDREAMALERRLKAATEKAKAALERKLGAGDAATPSTVDRKPASAADTEAEPAASPALKALAKLKKRKEESPSALSPKTGEESAEETEENGPPSLEGEHAPRGPREKRELDSHGRPARMRGPMEREPGAEAESGDAPEGAGEELPDAEPAPAGSPAEPPLFARPKKAAAKAKEPLAPLAKKARRKTAAEQAHGLLRAAKARTRRESIVSEMQAKIAKVREGQPLSPKEEEAAREELGLQDPRHSPKDVARKKHTEDLKKAKRTLEGLDLEIAALESNEIEHNVSDLSLDGPENTQSRRGLRELSPDELKGITSARDSDDPTTYTDDEKSAPPRSRLKNKTPGPAFGADEALYMAEADLQPLGNAWEAAGDHYVYLDAQTRYKGFNRLEDLLPLWFFSGDGIPELLGKTRQWRFFGSLPVQAKTVKELPADVREFLLGLRDQKQEAARDEREDPGSGARMARLRAALSEADEAGSPGSGGGEEEGENREDQDIGQNALGEDLSDAEREGGKDEESAGFRKRRKAQPGERDSELLSAGQDSLSPEAGEISAELNEAASPASGTRRKRAGADDGPEEGLEAPAAKRRNGLSDFEALKARLAKATASIEEPLDEAAGGDSDPAGGETGGRKARAEAGSGGERNKGTPEAESGGETAQEENFRQEAEEAPEATAARADRAALEEGTGEEETSLEAESGGSSGPAPGGASSEMERLRARLNNAEEEGPEKGSPGASEGEHGTESAEGIAEKLAKDSSPAIQSFLERRKAKQAAAPEEAASERKNPLPRFEEASGPLQLGILVALSDALFPNKGFARGLAKVLLAIEISFADCTALVTDPPAPDGSARVRGKARGSGFAEESVALSSGISFPVRSHTGASQEVLGYLFLKPSGPRSSFSEQEEKAAGRVAQGLWPLLQPEGEKGEAKAA